MTFTLETIIIALVAHIILSAIFSAVLSTKNGSFGWMFVLGVPIGAIIAILLDIKDNTTKEENKEEKPILCKDV